MIATAQVGNVSARKVAPAGGGAAATVPTASEVTVRDDASRQRELDLMAANIEGAAEGLAVFLLVALFGVVFAVAMLTGMLA